MKLRRWWEIPFALALLLLMISQVLTDRLGVLQLVWWIPRVFLAGFALLGFLLLLGFALLRHWPKAERARLGAWIGVSILFGVACSWTDWGLARERPVGAFRLVHWNACHPNRDDAVRVVDALLTFDADAVVLTDPGHCFADGGAERLAAAGYTIAQPGSFAIISRVGIVEARPVFASRGRSLSRFELDTPLGRLRLEGIDLPSDTTMPRFANLELFVAAITPVRGDLPDILAGDFNITRGSASLALLAPGTHEAFATAGVGWGGTYPRRWPFWAIDQMLVRAPWRAVRAEMIEAPVSRHRAHVVDLVRDGE